MKKEKMLCYACGREILQEPPKWRDYYVWEQFTGLHDKNGVEIYEGDIIHITKGLGNFANKKGQVVFTEGAFHIEGQGFTLSFASQYGIEVIGNIHEEELK